MEEMGLVIEERGATVLIKTEKSSSCDNCATKSACHSLSDSEMVIEAENAVGAHKGDYVAFSAGAVSVMKAGVLLYLVPVLSFIAGVVIGQTVVTDYFPAYNPDLVSGVLGVVFLAAAFIGLKLYSRRVEKDESYRPRVLRVVKVG